MLRPNPNIIYPTLINNILNRNRLTCKYHATVINVNNKNVEKTKCILINIFSIKPFFLLPEYCGDNRKHCSQLIKIRIILILLINNSPKQMKCWKGTAKCS